MFMIVCIVLLISVNSLVSNCHITTKECVIGGVGDKTYVSDARTFRLYITATYFFVIVLLMTLKISSTIYNSLLGFRLFFAMKTRRAVVWDITHRRLVITTIPLCVA